MRIDVNEAAGAADGAVLIANGGFLSERIVTDSNKAAEGALFIPVIGARVDGHKFIENAFDNGASAAFTSEELSEELMEKAADNGRSVIRVRDTVTAFQRLAAYYREKYVRIPYIGVTGSVGKTTTRELIACALGSRFNTYSTKGNANSQTGVPITVMATPADAEAGVIEMGMSEFGEMHRLSEIVRCDIAVMTVIGISHIANLGSQENIMKEKLHILDGMRDGGTLLLNGDDPMLKELTEEKIHEYGIALGKKINICFYGTCENAVYRACDIEEKDGGSSFSLYINGKKITDVRLFVPGMHMILNALSAIAAADMLGADIKDAAEALKGFKSLDGRGQITENRGIRIINDAYNAAPQSMKAGLKVLDSIKTDEGGRHTAVLADMLELGPDEIHYHEDIGRFIVNETKNIDQVLVYGELGRHIIEGLIGEADEHDNVTVCTGAVDDHEYAGDARCIAAVHFESFDALKKYVESVSRAGDAVFFKGSNSMRLWSMARDMIGE